MRWQMIPPNSIHAFVYPQDTATSYPLGLKTEKDGWITFNAPQVQQIPAGLYIYLYDQKLKEYHDLKTGPAYRLYLLQVVSMNNGFL